MGQAGAYIIHDADEDSLGLPSGYGKYDIPLILSSKQYNEDGTLFSTNGETDSLWGDVIHVVSPRCSWRRFHDGCDLEKLTVAFNYTRMGSRGRTLTSSLGSTDSGS